jgi:hypothetical protein
MVYPSEVIIVGGGKSIANAFNLPSNLSLQSLLATKFTILINYAYQTFPGTFLVFQDRNYYVPNYAKNYVTPPKNRHPDIYEDLKKLPLIVGINHNGMEEFKLDNTILLDKKYRASLTGIFALKILELLNFKGNCFLLGFDWSRRTNLPERDPNYNPNSDLQIHYYDTKHKGSGYVGYYENHNPDKEFQPFIKKDVKIYNVSLDSNIDCFDKISYEQFIKQLSNKIENQEALRNYIKNKLTN